MMSEQPVEPEPDEVLACLCGVTFPLRDAAPSTRAFLRREWSGIHQGENCGPTDEAGADMARCHLEAIVEDLLRALGVPLSIFTKARE